MALNNPSIIQTISFSLTLWLLGTANTAYAQSSLTIPGSAEVGQTDQSLPDANFTTPSEKIIELPDSDNNNAESPSSDILFYLRDINLNGVTIYEKQELNYLWANYINKEISIGEINQIAQSITNKYRNDGYILTQAIIPQQAIEDGVVEIYVVEGFIDSINIEGNIATKRIGNYAKNLKGPKPLNSSDLEKNLLLINDLPGISSRTVISPSQTTIGAADITIQPQLDKYNFNAALDNYGSRYIGPLQLSLSTQINNILGNGESAIFQYVTDPDDDERTYLYSRINAPVHNSGTTLGLDAAYSDTLPGYTLEPFQVEGRYLKFGIDLNQPIVRSRTRNLFSTLRFDYLNLKSNNIVDTFTTQDEIAAIRLGFNYNNLDTFWKPAINELSVQISQGINVFDASTINDPNLTRSDGDPQFTKIDGTLSRTQTLSNDLNLYTAIKGQLSNNPLLSSEEIGFGGRFFGRGYNPSEIVGDDGFGATIEARWKPDNVHDYEIFAFYDIGKIWNQETDNDALEKQSIASAGLGLRSNLTDNVSGEILIAQPLTKNVDVYNNTGTRFLFSVSSSF